MVCMLAVYIAFTVKGIDLYVLWCQKTSITIVHQDTQNSHCYSNILKFIMEILWWFICGVGVGVKHRFSERYDGQYQP